MNVWREREYAHVPLHIHKYIMRVRAYVRMRAHVRAYVRICVHMCAYVRICVHVCAYVCIRAPYAFHNLYMRAYVHIGVHSMHVCTYVRICV